MAKELKWFWLSFASGPPPNGFLGAAIVQALDFEEAIEEAWRRELNPGGEVRGGALAKVPDDEYRNRLLNRQEATDLVQTRKAEVE